MVNQQVFKGWLEKGRYYEEHETLLLGEYPISEELEDLTNKVVTLRYYISDKEDTLENLQDKFVRSLFGELESEYQPRYSEYTGYLWTDEEFKIGGHDLFAELEGYAGKFLYLIVDIEEKDE